MSNKLATVFALAMALVALLALALPGAAEAAPKCTIAGTEGKDRLHGTPGRDVICGRGGADQINGRGGNDRVSGGAGNDELRGGAGDDVLLGGAGDDLCLDGQSSLRRSCERPRLPNLPVAPRWPPCCKIDPDRVPPKAEWVTLSPKLVDTNGGDQNGRVAIEASDESGIDSVVVEITGPEGLWKTVSVPGDAGTRTSKEAEFAVPASTPPGDYRLTRATFTDRAGNGITLNAEQIAAMSPYVRLTTFAGPDESGPTLTDFTITPTEVAPGAAAVDLQLEAADALSGVEDATAVFAGPDQKGGGELVHYEDWKLDSGTRTDGAWDRRISLPEGATEGYYRLMSIHLHDAAGNTTSYPGQDLSDAGMQTEFLFAAGPDTTPPEILGLSFDRTTVSATAGESLEVLIQVRDDLSGFDERPNPAAVSEIWLEVEPGFPTTDYGWGGRGLVLESGSLLDGTWSRTIRLHEESAPGTYVVREIWATDRAGNKVTLTKAQLEAKGWPHSFTNVP